MIWGALLLTEYADILVLTKPLSQCIWGTKPRRRGVSCLFSACHQIQSRRLFFFYIANHSEWDGKILEVCLAQSLYWRRNLGTASHLHELKGLMFQSGKKLFSWRHLRSLTLEMRNRSIFGNEGSCCEMEFLFVAVFWSASPT